VGKQVKAKAKAKAQLRRQAKQHNNKFQKQHESNNDNNNNIMAALQRKLVHKQFNSPMGLYSQENVKATLNRELKAFGADG